MKAHDLVEGTIKASPSVTVVGLTVLGVPVQEWLILATIVYTLLQLYFLLRGKWWRQRKDKNGRK